MGIKVQRLILGIALLLASVNSFAQEKEEQKDSLVRLVKAKSLELITKDNGEAWRKVVEGTFLHNGTYFISDTAYWNVDQNVINALGNVRLTQDSTVLHSEFMDYFVDDNLAKFYGGVVQLQDKDENTLRTMTLDYNTADSVAVFNAGGAFRDKDGQVIESEEGEYDSKKSLFTFNKDVNMYTDSVFIKTSEILYNTDYSRATFPVAIDFWKDDNMLSAGRGWYNHDSETFFFTDKVHALSKDQETWSDSLFFYRAYNDVLLLGSAQVQDSTHSTSAVAGYIYYCDSLSKVTLKHKASVAMETDAEKRDSLFFGADTLIYFTKYRCDISDESIKAAQKRLDDIMTDPVGQYRKKSAEEAAKAAEAAAMNNENARGKMNAARNGKKGDTADNKPQAPAAPAAPAPESAPADTSSTPAPQPEEIPDSTKVGFAYGIGHVRVYRQDIQVLADSLRYSDLDSIARFYVNPIVWNDGNRQYSSDSLFTLIKNQRVERASLMSNAMILTQEDTLCYDQIRGAEVLAYFDSTSALRRFDALGGANAMFFLEENETLSTVNKVECKMLSGTFKDGTLDRVYFYDKPHNDAYPLAQLSQSDRFLKGFDWQPEKRPSSPRSITDLKVRKSERAAYLKRPRASFQYTDIYFPGYMQSVYDGIEYDRTHPKQKPKKKPVTPEELKEAVDSLPAQLDSVVTNLDSLAVSDSLAVRDSLAIVDSLGLDSLAAGLDSLAVADSLANVPHEPTKEEIKAAKAKAKKEAQEAKRAAREAKRAEKIAAREARWAELDAIDAEKAAAKKEKQLAKKREQTRKVLIERQKQEAKERAILQKYIDKYQKEKDRKDGKHS